MKMRNSGTLEEKSMFLQASIVIAFMVLVLVGTTAKYAADWETKNRFIFQKPVELKVQKPYRIEKIKPKEILSPLAKEAERPIDELKPIERKIVEKWGLQYGYIALAVFRCESGLREDAINWDTKDVGIAQINLPTWKSIVEKEFGYTTKDLLDADKNLEVAYWIWDRSDGNIGDGKGKFDDWVAFSNGSFAGCVK